MEVKETLDGKGRGVFAIQNICATDFVCEYETYLVYPRHKIEDWIKEYDTNDEGSYIVEAQVQGKWMCFDATRRFGGIGRYLNHGKSQANCKLHPPLFVREKWRLAVMAKRDIMKGEELLWDYNAPAMGNKWLMSKSVCKLIS